MTALQTDLGQIGARHDRLAADLDAAEQRHRTEQERHAHALSALEAASAEQLAGLAGRTTDLDGLRQAGERQERALDQLRADVARLQRQAERDLTELREANTALATSLLISRGGHAG